MSTSSRRSFRPNLDGFRLEDRLVLSTATVTAAASTTTTGVGVPPETGQSLTSKSVQITLNQVAAAFKAFQNKYVHASQHAIAALANGQNEANLVTSLKAYASLEGGLLQTQLDRLSKRLPGGETFLYLPPDNTILNQQGFDLQLVSWGNGSSVPTSGKSLVIVGTDNNGLLHIRIFDSGGNQIDDTNETLLPAQAVAIATLKQQLPGLQPPHALTTAEKQQVIEEATAIVGVPHQQTYVPASQRVQTQVNAMLNGAPGGPVGLTSSSITTLQQAVSPSQIQSIVQTYLNVRAAGKQYIQASITNKDFSVSGWPSTTS